MTIVTRFAPAPTGWLHLGHLVNAVWAWGVARALGGSVLLRVEDHDGTRCRPEFAAGILEDLAWLGLEPDGQVPRQSSREAEYRAALAALQERGLVYGCRCSRREIAAAGGDAPDVETPYPGTCRDLGLPLEGAPGARVAMEPGPERFDDARLGPQSQEPAAQCGDLRTLGTGDDHAERVEEHELGMLAHVRGDVLQLCGCDEPRELFDLYSHASAPVHRRR